MCALVVIDQGEVAEEVSALPGLPPPDGAIGKKSGFAEDS